MFVLILILKFCPFLLPLSSSIQGLLLLILVQISFKVMLSCLLSIKLRSLLNLLKPRCGLVLLSLDQTKGHS